MSVKLTPLYALLALVALQAAAAAQSTQPDDAVQATRFAPVAGQNLGAYSSSDARHIVSVMKRKSKTVVVIDDQAGGEFDTIVEDKRRLARVANGLGFYTPLFSPDGNHTAYIAARGLSRLVVVDGKAGPGFDAIIDDSLSFSSDSQRVAYTARKGRRCVVVADGLAGPAYDSILTGTPIFSPDGKSLVYAATDGNDEFVVVNGKPGPHYDAVPENVVIVSPDGMRSPYYKPLFSPDGKRMAYLARKGDKEIVVADGQPQTAYDCVMKCGRCVMAFSPDGSHLVYEVAHGKWETWRGEAVCPISGPMFVVEDGQPGNGYDVVSYLAFSPDGKHVAYEARLGSGWVIVDDGLQGAQYDNIFDGAANPQGPQDEWDFVPAVNGKGARFVSDAYEAPGLDAMANDRMIFSADGKRLAYVAKRGAKSLVVVNGLAGPEYDAIGEWTVAFSADGQRLAYAARNGAQWFVVADGKQGPPYDGILPGPLGFSSDGDHLIYAALSGQKYVMMTDGQLGPQVAPKYDDILCRVTDPAKNHVVFVVAAGKKQIAVCDGHAGPAYDSIPGRTIEFSPDARHIAYVAVNGRKQLLVTDGQPGPEFDDVNVGQGQYLFRGPYGDLQTRHDNIFSPDGKRVAYIAHDGRKCFAVVDNQPSPPCDMIPQDSLEFSPDSKHMAYIAMSLVGPPLVVLDGHAEAYHPVSAPGFRKLRFDPDGTLQYVGTKDGVVYRVRHRTR